MIYRRIIAATLVTAIYSSASFAFFCPKNFNQINIGDSLATVQQLCGAADAKNVKDAPDNSPQEWNYFMKQQGPTGMANAAQGTLKTSFAFDGNGKLVNISINGIGVGSTSNCGSPISLGDSRESVQASCGKPGFINKENQPSSTSSKPDDETNKLVELTYTSSPPVTLIFEGGKLTGKR